VKKISRTVNADHTVVVIKPDEDQLPGFRLFGLTNAICRLRKMIIRSTQDALRHRITMIKPGFMAGHFEMEIFTGCDKLFPGETAGFFA